MKTSAKYYGLYDTLNDGLCIMIDTSIVIAEKFKTSVNSFHCSVSRETLFRNRYEVVAFNRKDIE